MNMGPFITVGIALLLGAAIGFMVNRYLNKREMEHQ